MWHDKQPYPLCSLHADPSASSMRVIECARWWLDMGPQLMLTDDILLARTGSCLAGLTPLHMLQQAAELCMWALTRLAKY